MKIKIDCKKIVTKICLNIELEGFDIETYKNILHLAGAKIRDQYCGGQPYLLEKEMLRQIQKELEQ